MADDPVILSATPDRLNRLRQDNRRLFASAASARGTRPARASMLAPGQVFRVLCTKTGGANGSAPSTRASWVFTVKTIDGQDLATAAAPEELFWPGVVYVDPGAGEVRGIAYIKEDGVPTLIRVDIEPQFTACPAPA